MGIGGDVMSDLYGLALVILVNVIIYGLVIWGIVHMIYKRSKHPAHTIVFLAMIVCFVIFTASVVQQIMYRDWTINVATLAPMTCVFSIYVLSRRERRNC